jgi:hypothetical protein
MVFSTLKNDRFVSKLKLVQGLKLVRRIWSIIENARWLVGVNYQYKNNIFIDYII